MSGQYRRGGIFITFEGPDASGKTTQIGMLKQYLEEAEVDCNSDERTGRHRNRRSDPVYSAGPEK